MPNASNSALPHAFSGGAMGVIIPESPLFLELTLSPACEARGLTFGAGENKDQHP
jgi:hypothetical protein